MEFIIDFDRINELTTHIGDNKNESPYPIYTKGISKRVINDMLERFLRNPDKCDVNTINTLIYNGIVITKAEKRESIIKKILDE